MLTVKLGSALIVLKSITVTEVSQLCATKRMDCILIVDNEERPSRIFTAKDMAHRVHRLSLTFQS
ncbi:hypothetical protein PISMIDRAFT_103569 [Pisolithus microcarpus 441]|uniref:CBS domain-containing protein n=1 Tax=Pisolithus microcarpus 441 TaxID=765257 RepID=A0A0C9YY42_9AGAM|nr:hypothetical protein BKA83DRAFT_103569 [Pisolithus microcarpus]KIK21706.1 hypothetical protein PISMIDRAFT_103569 [Pisolithus microcarpus 441]